MSPEPDRRRAIDRCGPALAGVGPGSAHPQSRRRDDRPRRRGRARRPLRPTSGIRHRWTPCGDGARSEPDEPAPRPPDRGRTGPGPHHDGRRHAIGGGRPRCPTRFDRVRRRRGRRPERQRHRRRRVRRGGAHATRGVRPPAPPGVGGSRRHRQPQPGIRQRGQGVLVGRRPDRGPRRPSHRRRHRSGGRRRTHRGGRIISGPGPEPRGGGVRRRGRAGLHRPCPHARAGPTGRTGDAGGDVDARRRRRPAGACAGGRRTRSCRRRRRAARTRSRLPLDRLPQPGGARRHGRADGARAGPRGDPRPGQRSRRRSTRHHRAGTRWILAATHRRRDGGPVGGPPVGARRRNRPPGGDDRGLVPDGAADRRGGRCPVRRDPDRVQVAVSSGDRAPAMDPGPVVRRGARLRHRPRRPRQGRCDGRPGRRRPGSDRWPHGA